MGTGRGGLGVEICRAGGRTVVGGLGSGVGELGGGLWGMLKQCCLLFSDGNRVCTWSPSSQVDSSCRILFTVDSTDLRVTAFSPVK